MRQVAKLRATATMIPKRLIQTSKSANLSLLGRAVASNLRLLHPDFEYCFFDDAAVSSFLDAEFPQYRRVFDQFRLPIQRYDFFRYLAVYRLGGFYFDTDVLLAKCVTPLLDCPAVFSFEELSLSHLLPERFGVDWEIGNYAFGAEAGHPFLKAIIDDCVRGQEDSAWAAEGLKGFPRVIRPKFEAFYTTGPGAISRTLAERPEVQPTVTILFPHNILERKLWHKFGDYGVHLMQGTWVVRAVFWRRRIAHFWERRRRRLVAKRSQLRGPTRPGPWVARYPVTTGL